LFSDVITTNGVTDKIIVHKRRFSAMGG
jgi:hypothetical protein